MFELREMCGLDDMFVDLGEDNHLFGMNHKSSTT